MRAVTTRGDGDEQAAGAVAVVTEDPGVIVAEIFNSALARPDLARLVGPLQALWDADDWTPDSIIDAVEAIGFGKTEGRSKEGES